MAERRMFSRKITSSARFLKMPLSSQALYFHLGQNADDDGVVEAYTVVQTVGAAEDDLRVLCSKGFVQVLNEDLVTYITDWRENNRLRADRKIDSIYKELLLQMVPDAYLLEPKLRADVAKKRARRGGSGQWTTNGQPVDDQWTAQDRIGKDRLVQDSLVEGSLVEKADKPPKSPRHKYGHYSNVLLSDEDLKKLKSEFSDWEQRIERLSEYMASTGKSYKNHLATIRNWARRDTEKKPSIDTDYGDPLDFYK